MTVFKHEIRRGKLSFIIWTGVLGFLLAVCILIFPEMKKEMAQITETFASMGSFTAAFGMDKLNFGTLEGYYAVECGNVLGLGGALFASLIAVSMLSKEERDKTAEFLLTHPISRRRIVAEKLLAVVSAVSAMHAAILLISVGSIAAVGEALPWKEILLLHASYYLCHLEIALICYGVSAFIGKGGVVIGLGIAASAYFLNIIANLSDSVKFLKYVTPFGYCDGSEIVSNGALDGVKILIGAALGAAAVCAAFVKYEKKDIA